MDSARHEWKSHGPLILATFTGFSFLTVMTVSISLFMEPVSHAFGWSRTFVSIGYTCATVVTASLSPFFGIVLDRFGPRRVALPGIAATTASIMLFSLNNGSQLLWVTLWIVFALVALAVKTTVWTAAVSGVFRAGRGLALGFTLCGAGAAQIILPPIANLLIKDIGWRAAYAALGLGWGGLTFLLCWLFLVDGVGTRRRSGAPRVADASIAAPLLDGISVAEAWRSRALWCIGLSTLISTLLTTGMQVHQIPILEAAGVSRDHAALLFSLSGISAICGKLLTGVLLDGLKANRVGGATLSLSALAFILLFNAQHAPAIILLVMIVVGYTQGTTLQICSYLTARYAGLRNFGKIFGMITSVIAIGSGIGPLVAAMAYDMSGNYSVFLVIGAIGSIVSALLILSLPDYQPASISVPNAGGRLRSA